MKPWQIALSIPVGIAMAIVIECLIWPSRPHVTKLTSTVNMRPPDAPRGQKEQN